MRKNIQTILLSGFILMMPHLISGQVVRVKQGAYLRVSQGNTLQVQQDLIVEGYNALDNLGVVKLKGNLKNSAFSPLTIDSGLVIMQGTVPQSISGNILFGSLNIKNAAGVTIRHDITVNKTLGLFSGNLSLGSYNLQLGAHAQFAGYPSNTSMVVASGAGELRKQFTAPGTFAFPVGDQTGIADYSPVVLNFTSGTFGSNSNVAVNLVNAKYPDPNIQSDYLNRYWNISSSNISGYSCNAQFFYKATDVTGTESKLYCERVNPTPVKTYNAANEAGHFLSASGMASFGTFTGAGAPCYTLQTLAYVVNEVSCYGGANGSASVTVTGGTGIHTYQWGTTPVQTTQTAVGLAAGTYIVQVTDSLGCSTSASVVINQPAQWWAGVSGPANACSHVAGNLYTTETGMTNYDWTVSAGGTIISGAATNTIAVTWNTTGAHSVSATYSTQQGCSPVSATVFDVTVTSAPAIAGNITGAAALCSGSQAVSYTIEPIAGALDYIWTLPAGTSIVSGAGTPAITVDFAINAISGIITVHGSNLCGDGLAHEFPVVVNPIPATPLAAAVENTLSSTAPLGNQWYYTSTAGGAGTVLTGANNQTYVATQNGWYWTEVSLGGCSSDTSNHVHIISTGMEELPVSDFMVYPVPNDGKFTVKIITSSPEKYNLSVYNKIGQKIYEIPEILVDGKYEQLIDLQPVPNGIYMLVVQNGKQKMTRNITVIK